MRNVSYCAGLLLRRDYGRPVFSVSGGGLMLNALHCVGFLLPGLRAAGFFPFRAERMRRRGR